MAYKKRDALKAEIQKDVEGRDMQEGQKVFCAFRIEAYIRDNLKAHFQRRGLAFSAGVREILLRYIDSERIR